MSTLADENTMLSRHVLNQIPGNSASQSKERLPIMHSEVLRERFINVMLVLHLNSSPNIVRVIKSRRMRWAGLVARMGERRSVYRVLVRKPEGKRPLWRPRRRWEDNIKIELQEVGC
jgi:hypothetical protein